MITLDDRRATVSSRIAGLQNSLSGDFGKHVLRCAAIRRRIPLGRLRSVPYLSSARVEEDADSMSIWRHTHSQLRDNSVRVNALQLNAEAR